MAAKKNSARKRSTKKTTRKPAAKKPTARKKASSRKPAKKGPARKRSAKRTQGSSAPSFTSISGPFEGKISTPGVLHIASNGRFKATVDAGAVQLDGDFNGRINAKGDVLITKGAKASGAFAARCILIEEGADFDGRCRVRKAA
ncbi:MAG: polymer-forming cytoskeletal protein [Phycisphaerales bacterium]